MEQSQQINDAIAGNFQATAWRNHPGFDPDTQWVWWHCDATPEAVAPTGADGNPAGPAPKNVGLAPAASATTATTS